MAESYDNEELNPVVDLFDLLCREVAPDSPAVIEVTNWRPALLVTPGNGETAPAIEWVQGVYPLYTGTMQMYDFVRVGEADAIAMGGQVEDDAGAHLLALLTPDEQYVTIADGKTFGVNLEYLAEHVVNGDVGLLLPSGVPYGAGEDFEVSLVDDAELQRLAREVLASDESGGEEYYGLLPGQDEYPQDDY